MGERDHPLRRAIDNWVDKPSKKTAWALLAADRVLRHSGFGKTGPEWDLLREAEEHLPAASRMTREPSDE